MMTAVGKLYLPWESYSLLDRAIKELDVGIKFKHIHKSNSFKNVKENVEVKIIRSNGGDNRMYDVCFWFNYFN